MQLMEDSESITSIPSPFIDENVNNFVTKRPFSRRIKGDELKLNRFV